MHSKKIEKLLWKKQKRWEPLPYLAKNMEIRSESLSSETLLNYAEVLTPMPQATSVSSRLCPKAQWQQA